MSRAPQRFGLAAWLIATALGSCSPQHRDKLLIKNETPSQLHIYIGGLNSPPPPHFIYKVAPAEEYPLEYHTGIGCFSCFPDHNEPFARVFREGLTITTEQDKKVHLPFKQLRAKVTHDGGGWFRLEIKPSDL